MLFARTRRLWAACLIAAGLAAGLASGAAAWQIEPIAQGFDTPWAVEQLPEGGYLVTERDGRLLYVDGATRHAISGVPRVAARGQGGLLDVTLPRDFETSREVLLTYSKPQRGGGAGTALAVGELSADNKRLLRVRDLFESVPASKGGRHFGSRVVEAADGTLFVTMGDRGDGETAQDRTTHNGSILRISRDGSIPDDNPFIGQNNIRPEIWSYGHRNPQGAGLDAQGTLWTAEHGARGGDEVNRIVKGSNYGWPVISYGRHYSGAKIGEGTAKPGMSQPEFYWDPSIAPSGLLVHSGTNAPDWKGNIFVGSLKFDYIARLGGAPLAELEQIKTEETLRVRDLIETPDGSILFLSVSQGTLYRLAP
ncbi:PQQ-dependent sugar dehydrogenase [Aliishimia ponticola]|uniref:PQQ-dependent sugar dehydrogenase n=1 Tax=Aliishimia ponticola TaxID=2499833 RepID=A0A4S4NI28_9RHOB|nr:PQQ-dependent sugar dehydrogenase [Aliishimia ponticola]THH38535.1 PQQ-dependent sugar dehydrogenase [Aliishimia ponticola]